MQEMSFSRRHSAPWLANVVTVMALVGTTWWSGEQRPVGAAREAASQAAVPAGATAIRVRDGQSLPVSGSDKAVIGLTTSPQATKSSVVLAAWRAAEPQAQRGTAPGPAFAEVRVVPTIVDH